MPCLKVERLLQGALVRLGMDPPGGPQESLRRAKEAPGNQANGTQRMTECYAVTT